MYRPPILGFDDWSADPSVHVRWQDGTPVATVGILGNLNPETLAREQAERDYKQQLRDQDVVVLSDWRNND